MSFKVIILVSAAAAIISFLAIYLALDLRHDISVELPEEKKELAYLAIKQDIYAKFTGIFLTILTVMAAVTGLLGVTVYEFLKRRIETDYKKVVADRIRLAQATSLAFSYNEDAYVQWLFFEPVLQELLNFRSGKGRKPTKRRLTEAQRSVSLAIKLSGNALKFVGKLDPEHRYELESSYESLHPYVNLLNVRLYSQTAQLILIDEAPSQSLLEELCESCDSMVSLGMGEFMASQRYDWWETAETACFFYFHIGKLKKDDELLAKADELLDILAAGKQAKSYLKDLPETVSTQAKREYIDRYS